MGEKVAGMRLAPLSSWTIVALAILGSDEPVVLAVER